MKDPIKEAYLNFDNKCRSYRKKLSDSPELLEKYNKAFDEHREKIRVVKRGLTVKSSSDDIDRYNRMCFDACQDLQDLAKQLRTLNQIKKANNLNDRLNTAFLIVRILTIIAFTRFDFQSRR